MKLTLQRQAIISVRSALLTVTGSMALGLSRLETGIKIRANIRSSAALEGNFHMRGSQLVRVEFGIPQTQMDVIEYAYEIMFSFMLLTFYLQPPYSFDAAGNLEVQTLFLVNCGVLSTVQMVYSCQSSWLVQRLKNEGKKMMKKTY